MSEKKAEKKKSSKAKKEKANGKAPKIEASADGRVKPEQVSRKFYEKELGKLQFEMIKLQYWIKEKGLRVVLLFEGRDAAGKGGLIKRITEPLDARGVRVVALGRPSDVERTQWYFQRYVAHLPSAGEIVVFDRSWYNRSGVERVMGFCTDAEYWDFLRSCPQFERMLVSSGIVLLKYYLSVSDDEQEKRFQERAKDPTRRWKLSPMDLEARARWVEYSKAKDIMLEHTDIPECRWYHIESNDKRRARLICMHHMLSMISYKDAIPATIKLPPRPPDDQHYVRPPKERHIILDEYFER